MKEIPQKIIAQRAPQDKIFPPFDVPLSYHKWVEISLTYRTSENSFPAQWVEASQ
jgi:hypothetical protein